LKAPRLSVVLVTDRFRTIRGVVSCLREQTIQDEVELVIVLPSTAAGEIDHQELGGFAATRVIGLPEIHPLPEARAAGVRGASAPIVFIGETHSFPHPGFAAALVAAHEGPWDVVVPGLGNANPDGSRSWSAFLLDYGSWMAGLPAAAIPNGPTWNASYKKSVLLELGSALDGALSSGDELPRALRARDCKVYFEPAAMIDHVNVESRGWADERYLSGLVVGANRGKQWSVQRRMLYLFASPLIPLVLLYRSRRPMKYLLKRRALPAGAIPALVAGAIVRTVGEAVGYARGMTPEAERRMDEYELHKLRYASRLSGVAVRHG